MFAKRTPCADPDCTVVLLVDRVRSHVQRLICFVDAFQEQNPFICLLHRRELQQSDKKRRTRIMRTRPTLPHHS